MTTGVINLPLRTPLHSADTCPLLLLDLRLAVAGALLIMI